jgi:hypothetical protein
MGYLNPRAIFSNRREPLHDAHVIDNNPHGYPGRPAVVATSVYAYKVVCSCQFEVLCVTKAEAEQWRIAHLANHGQQATEIAAPQPPPQPELAPQPKGASEAKVIA